MNVWIIVPPNPKVTVTTAPLMACVDGGECLWDKAGPNGNEDGVSTGKGSVEHCQPGSRRTFFSTTREYTPESVVVL